MTEEVTLVGPGTERGRRMFGSGRPLYWPKPGRSPCRLGGTGRVLLDLPPL